MSKEEWFALTGVVLCVERVQKKQNEKKDIKGAVKPCPDSRRNSESRQPQKNHFCKSTRNEHCSQLLLPWQWSEQGICSYQPAAEGMRRERSSCFI